MVGLIDFCGLFLFGISCRGSARGAPPRRVIWAVAVFFGVIGKLVLSVALCVVESERGASCALQ